MLRPRSHATSTLACLTSLTCLAAAPIVAGCGAANHIEAEATALGRVVVYRNGIAYYERRARVLEDALSITVPHHRVDDFLKSLTVADAVSGETLPISYPTVGASSESAVEMRLEVPGPKPRDVVLTYITDAPAWKPSYRLVVGEDKKVDVQGWAIVDNTSGEDWRRVRVGVGSSAALSFRYDLRSVMHVHREQLGPQRQFVQAPPTGGATHGQPPPADGWSLALADEEIAVARGDELASPDFDDAPVAIVSTASGMKPAESSRPAPAKRAERRESAEADARIGQLAARLRGAPGRVTIEGHAAADDIDGESQALERAHGLRNRLIELGVAPDQLRAVAGARTAAQGGVELRFEPIAAAAGEPVADDTPIGESHFESEVPVDIPHGRSAMVSVLHTDAAGEVVYLYAPDASRGDARYAFRAVRFRNPTTSTLEAGPVTVYGANRFIGEGLTDPIPPGSLALVPFALDRQVVVERKSDTRDEIERLVTVRRGALTAEIHHVRRTRFELTNRLTTPARVYVRHRVGAGWTLATETAERLGDDALVEVAVGPGESKTTTVEAYTPMRRRVDLTSPAGVAMLKDWLAGAGAGHAAAKDVGQLLALHDEIRQDHARMASLDGRMNAFRARMHELEAQVVELRDVEAGRALLRHLERKLRDVSDRIEAATVERLDTRERLMLARIRYQDAASELEVDEDEASSVARSGE